MSIQTFVRSLITVVALGVSSTAFAAPITRIPVSVKQVVTMSRTPSRQSAGYRDSFLRFGVGSASDTRAVPARGAVRIVRFGE